MPIRYQTGSVPMIFTNDKKNRLLVSKSYLMYFDIANKNKLFVGIKEINRITTRGVDKMRELNNLVFISKVSGVFTYLLFLLNILTLILAVNALVSGWWFDGIGYSLLTIVCGFINVKLSEFFEDLFVFKKLASLNWKLDQQETQNLLQNL